RDIAIPPGRKIDTSNNFSMEKLLQGVEAMIKGEYRTPSFQKPKPVQYPKFKVITVKNGENSFKLLADRYLDSEYRWSELKEANPELNMNNIPVGTKVN